MQHAAMLVLNSVAIYTGKGCALILNTSGAISSVLRTLRENINVVKTIDVGLQLFEKALLESTN